MNGSITNDTAAQSDRHRLSLHLGSSENSQHSTKPHYLYDQQLLSLADYQAQQQRPQPQSISSSEVPPPYSSATYAEFEKNQGQAYFNTQHATEPPALFSSSTLPRSMTIMESNGQGPHVAEVYQPKQHPTHKYWTLPRQIATGVPLPNGGPYIERPGAAPGIVAEAEQSHQLDEVDRFHQHHEQLQQARIKEIAEQHMKPIQSTTTTTTSGTTVKEEITHGTQTVTTSTLSQQMIQHVIEKDEPPQGATLLYETEDATFYTVPIEENDELDQGIEATSSKTLKTTTYAVPKRKVENGIGPVNESGVPITPKAVSALRSVLLLKFNSIYPFIQLSELS